MPHRIMCTTTSHPFSQDLHQPLLSVTSRELMSFGCPEVALQWQEDAPQLPHYDEERPKAETVAQLSIQPPSARKVRFNLPRPSRQNSRARTYPSPHSPKRPPMQKGDTYRWEPVVQLNEHCKARDEKTQQHLSKPVRRESAETHSKPLQIPVRRQSANRREKVDCKPLCMPTRRSSIQQFVLAELQLLDDDDDELVSCEEQ